MEITKEIILASLLMINMHCMAQQEIGKSITENDMNVNWHFENDRVYFEMSAPTNGWVAIGFNTHTVIKDSYLLMGNLIDNQPNVVEHYTVSPGNYKPISDLGESSRVKDVSGRQNDHKTTLKFSLPTKALSKYQRDLFKGSYYVMIMAYSREDDFQHHSMMRTSVKINL